jgi:hypothetical protein
LIKLSANTPRLECPALSWPPSFGSINCLFFSGEGPAASQSAENQQSGTSPAGSNPGNSCPGAIVALIGGVN